MIEELSDVFEVDSIVPDAVSRNKRPVTVMADPPHMHDTEATHTPVSSLWTVDPPEQYPGRGSS
jgi:hypothetical protein